MQRCDERQIEIERRLHGALGQAETAALDDHLRSCAACRAYQAAACGTEEAMEEQAAAVLRGVDWEVVRRSVVRHRGFWAADLWLTLAGLAGALVVTWALAPAARRGDALLVMGLAALAMAALEAQRALGRLRDLRPDGEAVELLAEHRGRIRRDLTRWRRQLQAYAILPAAVAVSVVLHWPDLSALPFLLAISGVVGAMAAYDLLVRLPRVRRELADLEPRGQVGAFSLDAAAEAAILAAARGRAAERAQAFDGLFRALQAPVLALALHLTGRRADAEDALQEAFLDVHRGLAAFRGEARLSTWVYRIAVRAALRVRARRGEAPPAGPEGRGAGPEDAAPVDGLAEPGGGGEAALLARLEARRIAEALDRLPAEHRTVLSLFALKGLSHQEVAEILGVPEGTVWSRLHAARSRLAAEVGRDPRRGVAST